MAPLIVIAGPTASGKSSLALRVAQRWNGEIVCADSRTVYRGLDIGTAKPSSADQQLVRHHLLDIVDPDKRFTVHDFQNRARQAIADIRRRGNVPLLVGGTGLYIDSIVLDFQLGPERDTSRRQQLQKCTVNELQTMLKKQLLSLPENSTNKRYLIRTIERIGHDTSRKERPDAITHVVAIATEKNELRDRINERIQNMFKQGIETEAAVLAQKWGWECEALSGNSYRVLREYLQGNLTKDAAVEQCATRDWRLAKRQMTWLRRHDFVQWLDMASAEQYINGILQAYYTEQSKGVR